MTIAISELPQPALRHYVLAAYEAWGHTRPLCTLAARIAKSRPVIITIFTTRSFHARAENEISRNFSPEETEVRARVRLVAVHTREDVVFDTEVYDASFLDAYQKLVNEEPIICARTGEQMPAVRSPDAAIFDVFSHRLLLLVRKMSEKDVKVFGWAPISAASSYYLFGPAGGHTAETPRAVEEEMRRSGRSVAEVTNDMMCHKDGRVMQVPGIPAMYDYEHFPQESIIPDVPVGLHHLAGIELLNACDSVLVSTSEYFEPPEAIDAFRRWFAETSRKTYVVGPMIPTGPQASMEDQQSHEGTAIEELMARVLQSHGRNSLIYISFGSLFWSVEPERIWTFIDVLLDKKIPFIMSHGSPFAQVPDWVADKVKASSIAFLSPWSPQQMILNHSVTGWFVTHCGWNSLVESMSAGVPMICWPYQADQALNTIHLTDNINIAYELTEVRTGHGLKPTYRNGKVPVATLDAIRVETDRILALAFGPDGAEKRAKVSKLQEKISQLWGEEGASRLALESFLEDL